MSSTNKTTNYSLNQFIGGDYWKREDWNADMEIIDTAVNELEENKFDKANISDSVASESSTTVASSTAVKTAYDLAFQKTDMGYTDGGALLGATSLVSGYRYYDGNGDWYKLKSTTNSPYTHNATDVADTDYLELISNKATEDKIASLFEENFYETVLFSGSQSSTGILTLSDDWDKYKKILFIGTTDGTPVNIKHNEFYTDYITASDSTSLYQIEECRFYEANSAYISGLFRDTNRNEIYITEVADDGIITQVIGIGKNS